MSAVDGWCLYRKVIKFWGHGTLVASFHTFLSLECTNQRKATSELGEGKLRTCLGFYCIISGKMV